MANSIKELREEINHRHGQAALLGLLSVDCDRGAEIVKLVFDMRPDIYEAFVANLLAGKEHLNPEEFYANLV